MRRQRLGRGKRAPTQTSVSRSTRACLCGWRTSPNCSTSHSRDGNGVSRQASRSARPSARARRSADVGLDRGRLSCVSLPGASLGCVPLAFQRGRYVSAGIAILVRRTTPVPCTRLASHRELRQPVCQLQRCRTYARVSARPAWWLENPILALCEAGSVPAATPDHNRPLLVTPGPPDQNKTTRILNTSRI